MKASAEKSTAPHNWSAKTRGNDLPSSTFQDVRTPSTDEMDRFKSESIVYEANWRNYQTTIDVTIALGLIGLIKTRPTQLPQFCLTLALAFGGKGKGILYIYNSLPIFHCINQYLWCESPLIDSLSMYDPVRCFYPLCFFTRVLYIGERRLEVRGHGFGPSFPLDIHASRLGGNGGHYSASPVALWRQRTHRQTALRNFQHR